MFKLFLVLIINFVIMYTMLYFIITFINKKTSESIPRKKLIIGIVGILYSLAVDILYVKYFFSEPFIRCSLVLIYVTLTGYIDHYTQYVYSFISYVFGGISLIFLGIDMLYYGDIEITLIGAVGCFIISFMFKLTKIPGHDKTLGDGDIDVFVISAIYIGGFTSILNIFLACSFLAIAGIFKAIMLRRLSVLKDKVALCPFIAISTFIILLCM